MNKEFYENDPNWKLIQYNVRLAFELGYRAAKPDCNSNEWRDSWKKSEPRKWLVDTGIISGHDKYR
jgi:hypothetical protein